MAFNINAQVVLSGPKNLNQITRKIQTGFGKVSNASLNLNIDPKNIKTLDALNRRVVTLTNNFTKLNTAINATGSSLNKINTTSTAVNNLTRSQNNLNKQANNVTQSIQQQNTALGSLTKRLSSVAKTAIAFGLISRPIYDLQRAFTGAVTDAIAFEKEIVKISQVTGQTVGQLAGLKDTIDSLATTLGSNANELAETARIITQTGKTAEETRIILTALARSTLAPTFGNITDTTEGLIAALGQFNLNAKDSEAILGSLNKVSKNFAVESEDLISAIRRTGGVFAQAAGESKGTIGALQELSAIFTAVRSTTRESADTIAAGLRTIFSRIQRRGTIEFLEQFNIQLTDAKGKFVGIFPAFDQLSTRLDTLIKQGDALTLSAIAEELGGIRQIGKLLPAIAQFDKARQALQDAQQGAVEGLGVDVAKGLDTLDNRIRRVQESFNELIRTVFDSNAFQDFAKGILSSSEAILKAGTQIVETLEPIFPLLTSIGAIKLGKGIGGLIGGGAIGGAISTVTGQASANASQAAAQAAQQSAAATQNNTQAVSQINATLSRVSNQLANIFRSLEASFIQNTRQIANIFSSVEGNFNRLSIQMGNLIQALGGFGTQINAASAKIVGFAGAAISKPSNRVVGFAGARTTRATGGEIPKFQKGGWVKGPSHAAGGVIAELEGGEYVVPKKAMQSFANGEDVDKLTLGNLKDPIRSGFRPTGPQLVTQIAEKRKESRFSGSTQKIDPKSKTNKLLAELKTIDNQIDSIPDVQYGGAFLSPEGQGETLKGFVAKNFILRGLKKTSTGYAALTNYIKAPGRKNSQIKNIYEEINKSISDESEFILNVRSLDNKTSLEVESRILNGVSDAVLNGANYLSTNILGGTPGASVSDVGKILSKTNINNIIGNIFEGILLQTGAPYGSADRDQANALFDFPSGLGPVADAFVNGEALRNTTSDAKTRYTNRNISTFLDKVKNTEANLISDKVAKAFKLIENDRNIFNALKDDGTKNTRDAAILRNTIFNDNAPSEKAITTSGLNIKEQDELNKLSQLESEGKLKTSKVIRLNTLRKRSQGKALGGIIQSFAGGGVPVRISNGEAIVPAQSAKGRYNELKTMNKTGEGNLSNFSGTSIAKGPGSGTSDSIFTSLNPGDFVIKERSTKKIQSKASGGVIQKFAAGNQIQDARLSTLSPGDLKIIEELKKAEKVAKANTAAEEKQTKAKNENIKVQQASNTEQNKIPRSAGETIGALTGLLFASQSLSASFADGEIGLFDLVNAATTASFALQSLGGIQGLKDLNKSLGGGKNIVKSIGNLLGKIPGVKSNAGSNLAQLPKGAGIAGRVAAFGGPRAAALATGTAGIGAGLLGGTIGNLLGGKISDALIGSTEQTLAGFRGNQGFDENTVKFRGSLTGGFTGGGAGAGLGAAIGTLIAPGIGTAIGAAIGGGAGSIVGSIVGSINKPLEQASFSIAKSIESSGKRLTESLDKISNSVLNAESISNISSILNVNALSFANGVQDIITNEADKISFENLGSLITDNLGKVLLAINPLTSNVFASDQLLGTDFVSSFENSAQEYLRGFDETWGTAIAASNRSKKIIAKQLANLKDLIKEEDIQKAQEQYARSIAQFFSSEGTNLFSGVDISTDDGAKQFNDTLLLMSKNGNDYAQSLIEFENALVKQQLTFRSVQLAQTGTQQDTTTAAAINTVLSSGININNISELQTFLTDQGFDPGDVTIFLNELGKARNALNEFEETAKKQVELNNLLKESASIIKSYNLAILNSTRGLSQSLSDASDSFNIFAARVNNIKLNSGEITTRDIGSRSLENQISLIENISGGNLQEFRQVNQVVDTLPIAIEGALNKLTTEDFGPNASAQITRDVITDSISQLTNLVPGEAISQALFANLRSLVSSRQTAGASPTTQVPKKLNELLNAGDIDSLLKDVVAPLQESFEEQKKGAEILRKDFENRVNFEIQRLRDVRNFEAEILQRRLNNEDVIANILDRTQNTVLKSLTTLERQVSTAGGGNSDINTLLQRRGFAQQRQQQLQSQVDLGNISERTGSELIFMGSVIEETSKALEKFANDTSVAAAAQQEAAKIRERTDSSERGIDGLINAFSSGNRETVQAVLQQQQALRNVTLGLGTFQEALLVFKNIDDPIISALNRSRFGEEGAREFERTLRTQLAEQFKGTPVEGIANELLNSIDNDNANLVRLATDANVFAQKQLEVLRIIEQQNNVAINNAAGGAGVNNFDQSVNKFAAAIDRFTKATGQAQFTTQLQAINDNRKRLGLPPIIFAKGGPVYRSSGGPSDMSQFARGTDTVPAMLTPGEYVINKKAVDKYGSKTLSDINDGKAELYSASGGLVYLRKGGTFNFGSKKYKFERDRNGIIGDNTMVGQGIDQFDEYMGLFGSIISNTTIGGIQDELSKNTFNFGSKKYRMERDRNGIIGDDTMVGKTIDLYKNTKIKDLINPRAIPEGINKIVEDINTPITVKKYDGLYDPKRLTNNDYVEPKYLESKPTEKQTIDSYRSIKDQISKIINSVKKENRSLNSFERSAYDEYLNLYSRFKDKQLLQDTLIPLPKISSSDSADAAVKKYNENAAKQPGVVGDDYFAKFAAPSTGINYNQGLYNNPIGFNNGGIVPDYKRFGGIMYANVRKYDQQILNYISTFTSKARQRKLLNEYLDLQNRFNRIVIPGIQYHEQQIIRGNPGYDIQKNRFFVNAKNLMASKLPKLINLFPPKRIVKDRFAGAITITQKDIQDNIEDQVIESSKINAIDKFSFFQTGGKVRYTKEAKALQNGGQSLGINFKKRGTDTVPAMLTPGEFVIKKESVQKYGTGLMNDLNKGKAPMFAANGGPVYKQTGGFIGVTQTQKPQQANMILNSDRAAKMLQQSIIDGGSKVTAQWQQLFDGITQKLNQALVPISTIPEVINAQVAPIEIQGVNSFVEAIADNIIPKIQDHMQKLIGSTMNQKLQQGDGTF